MVKRIIMIVGDFAENQEVFTPLWALKMVGIEVVSICPNKKAGEKIATAVHDFEEW